MTESTGAEPITIKKYANRRLYNTATSSYVTLENLAAMVREGRNFVVHDAKTGEDITRSVLTQIIFEEEAKGQNMLPVDFLRQIIRLYGDAMQQFVPGYLNASMRSFAEKQDEFREQMTKAFGHAPGLAQFEAMARSNAEWFENTMRMFSPFAMAMPGLATKPPREPEVPAAEPPASSASELSELKMQLAELQSRLEKLARG